MPRITIRISEQDDEFLEELADWFDWPKSSAASACIKAVRGESSHVTGMMLHDERRIDELEERVDQLEDALTAGDENATREPVEEAVHEQMREDEGDRVELLHDRVINQLLDTDLDDREIDAIVACVEYLRDAGEAAPGTFKKNVFPEHSAGSNSEEVWWLEKVKPHFEELDEVDYVNQRTIRYAG